MMQFPPSIEERAWRSSSAEYAWQRSDLPLVFAYCRTAALAIIGGEAWIVRPIASCGADEPTMPIDNLDPQRRRVGSVLARSREHVVYGTLLLRDGQNVVFSWSSSPRTTSQSWLEYAAMTVADTERLIAEHSLETEVVPEYAASVYYNIMFEREDGLWF